MKFVVLKLLVNVNDNDVNVEDDPDDTSFDVIVNTGVISKNGLPLNKFICIEPDVGIIVSSVTVELTNTLVEGNERWLSTVPQIILTIPEPPVAPLLFVSSSAPPPPPP